MRDACTIATAEADCGVAITCNTFYLAGFDKVAIAGLLELFLNRDIAAGGPPAAFESVPLPTATAQA